MSTKQLKSKCEHKETKKWRLSNGYAVQCLKCKDFIDGVIDELPPGTEYAIPKEQKNEEKVEVIEIWTTTDGKDAEAYQFYTGKNLKRVAIIANGYPLKLDSNFVMERKFVNEKQVEEWKKVLPVSSPAEQQNGWEEEFDKRFKGYMSDEIADKIVNKDFKDFFRKILSSYQDSILEEVEKYFKGLIYIPNPQATKENLIKIIKQK